MQVHYKIFSYLLSVVLAIDSLVCLQLEFLRQLYIVWRNLYFLYCLTYNNLVDDKNKAVDKAGGKLGTAGPPTGPGQAAPSRGRPPGGGNNSNSNTSAGTAAGAGAGGGALAVKQFNRNFVRALDEFIDRLGLSGTYYKH